ncbi:MAG: hypothetical protein Q9219_000615 [cf. Caloplaca sp. 3 TL-2023]
MPANKKLHRFPRSRIWDPQTQRTVDALRAYIHREPQPSISKIQQDSVKGRPLGNAFHCFQDVLPQPGDDVKDLLLQSIDEVKMIKYQIPDLAPVTIEWVGKRQCHEVHSDAKSLDNRQWTSLAQDTTSNLTILHVHGGAFFQGSPEAYRPTTSQLAALSGGQVVSVKYRLAPQYPFPAGLLDVFVAYLSLLYPHPHSKHQAIDPSTMVFAGDSVGGNLLYAVLQIIQLTQKHPAITFHSHTVEFPLPLPAGLATLSFAGDTLNSLPSYTLNRVNDLYLEIPWSLPNYPACELWPTDPPRPHIYAATSSYAHPFITPAMTHDCQGMPPMWFAVGEEQFIDASRAVAQRAARQGVQVDWVQFQAMPHCFAALPGLNRTLQAKACMKKWATFCKMCVVKGKEDCPVVKAVEVGFPDDTEREIALEDESTSALPLADVDQQIYDKITQEEKDFSIAWKGRLAPKL